MRFERAQEIYNSPQSIDVFYNGKSIWITSLDPTAGTAKVQIPEETNNIITVPVTQLHES